MESPNGTAGAERERWYPLSSGQLAMWLVAAAGAAQAAYTVHAVYELRGALDAGALRAAAGDVVAAHESLRTAFGEHDGEPAQRVLDVPAHWQERAAGDEEEASQLVAAFIAGDFDLAAGRVVRFLLVRRSADEHQLVVAGHHIVLDGWSLSVLADGLLAAYRARTTGAPVPVAPAVQYRDHAVAQRAELDGGRLEGSRAYWRGVLERLPEPLELPADRPRPGTRSFRGRLAHRLLDAEDLAALGGLCRQERVTLFAGLCALVRTLLHRYTGQEDFALGTSAVTRDTPELYDQIGYYLNTLALRGTVTADSTFRGVLRAAHAAMVEALEHHAFPFDQVVRDAGAVPEAGRNPLFDVMVFHDQGWGGPQEQVPGLRVRHLDVPYAHAKMDLTFFFKETAGGLRLTVEYATDLFDAERIEALLGHAVTLLRSCVAEPDGPVAALPLLTRAEHDLVVTGFNRTDVPFELETPLPQLFEQRAARQPQRVAVVDGVRSWTFGELNGRVNALAWLLREEHGVRPGVLVALAMERSAHLTVAVLAVLKAGGGYLPVSVKDPVARLAGVLEDSGVPLVLVAGGDFVPPPAAGRAVLDVTAVAGGRTADLPPLAGPDDVAYCVYTSGSTGRPKGVLVEHRGLVNRLRWTARDLGLGADDVFLQKTPYVFDVSVWELLLPGMLGARQVMPAPGAESQPALIAQAVREHGVTVVHFVPSMLERYLDGAPEGFAGVRVCVCSGEPLGREVARRFLAVAGPAELHNYYGPTEATVDVTAGRVTSAAGPVTLGRPVANTRVYVLDPQGRPCPVGVDGELCLSGVQVARGYLGRPELTAERFADDPFVPGRRMYRTGDLGRWLPGGELLYRGRRDGQVKLRGHRVEPAEIEAALRELPGVEAAVVLLRGDAAGGDHLCAFVQGAGAPDAAGLREALAARLPAYMVPARYAVIDAVPVTSNGKADRRALAALPSGRAATGVHVAPRDAAEEELLAIWRTLLPRGRVGVTDDFFVAGGHSLSALRLASRIAERFGVAMTAAAVFGHRTVADQAALLGTLPAVAPRAPAAGAGAAVGGPRPLSPAQERVWFLHMLEPDSSAYNIRVLVRLTGPLEPDALRRAAGALVARHEMLRVTFQADGDRVTQTVDEDAGADFTVRDLTHLDLAVAREAAGRAVREEDGLPFRLRERTPLRMTLLRVAREEHLLLVTLHHIAGDGWSMRLLTGELSALYARELGTPADLPELTVRYTDHAAALRDPARAAAAEEDLEHWVRRLTGAPVLELPVDTVPPQEPAAGAGRASVTVPAGVRRGLRELADATSTTVFEIVMATLNLLLSRLADSQDVVVGFPVANRPSVGLERVVGLFLNTLVLRTDLSGDPVFTTLLERVAGGVREAYEHQDVPFETLVERLNPVRRPDRTPVFDVLLNHLGDLREEFGLPGVAAEFDDRFFEPEAKFPLTLYVAEDGEGLRIDAVHRPDLFGPARMAETLRQFAGLLEQVAGSARQPLSAYRLAADGTADLAVPLPAPAQRTVTDLIGARAAAAPGRTAVTHGADAVTYGRLWERSGDAARLLVASGCRPGDVVAVTGPRGVGFVTALLGAWRAGAVVLPLDPALPEGRRRHLVTAGAPVLLVRSVEGADGGAPELPGVDVAAATGAPAYGGPVPDAVLPEVGEQAPAYLFFTSGTTGTPRAVLGWHGALGHFLAWQAREFGIGAGDRCSQLTSASFDVMLRDTLLALVAGGTVAVPEPHDLIGGKALFGWLERAGVTVLHAAPTVLSSWLLDVPGGLVPSGLRWVFSAGEPLKAALVESLRAAVPAGCGIVNLYGPTETTMAKFAHRVPDGPLPALLPVGSPLPDTRAAVLRGDVPCGVGEPGEIVIRTPFRSRGYLGGAGAPFTPNPFSDDPGDLLYRTGDVGRLTPDGLLEVIGRADHQIKIDGVRVHPAEVESALSRHPDVSGCVVTAHAGPDGAHRLIAYVVPAVPGREVAAALRAHLARELPPAMVPSRFVALERVPVNANGKPDRAALPDPGSLPPDVPAGRGPRGAAESAVRDAWETVLVRPVPDVGADFFALGGTSLKLLRLLSLLEEAFPGGFRAAQLFAHPTVAAQAALVAAPQAPVENEVVEYDF